MPLILHSDFVNSYREIVYKLNKNKAVYKFKKYFSVYEFVDHINYRQPRVWKEIESYRYKNTNYAFGILINPYYTKLLMLDFDEVSILSVEKIASLFMHDNVFGMDIVWTGVNRYHLYIGLDYYCDIHDILKLKLPYVCKGYINFINTSDDMIARVSDKKISSDIYRKDKQNGTGISQYKIANSGSSIIHRMSYRNESNCWYGYNGRNISQPQNFSDIPDDIQDTPLRKVPIKLRKSPVKEKTSKLNRYNFTWLDTEVPAGFDYFE